MARLRGELTITGELVSGLGEAAGFTGLDWVQEGLSRWSGFRAYPGTVNLRLPAEEAAALRHFLPLAQGCRLEPPAGSSFCSATLYAARIAGVVPAALVRPEVEGYPDDKLELMAPVPVRRELNLDEGERVSVTLAAAGPNAASAQELRRRRKVEHVAGALASPARQAGNGLKDLRLVHDCLPEVHADEVDTAVDLFGKRLALPLLVNAMTGGAPEVLSVNRALARVARAFGIAMAVGSQTAALRDASVEETYRVARQENPDGLLLANVGADAAVDAARRAVDMLEADALQVHLNPAQELFMREGDRDFRGRLRRIGELCRALPVPVMVKEVGCGVSAEAALRLLDAGVAAIDVSGRGGTNFVEIERRRAGLAAGAAFASWGQRTAEALLEVVAAVGGRVPVIASGGVRHGLDVAKCLAAGATAVGLAGPLVRRFLYGGEAALHAHLSDTAREVRCALALTGSRDVAGLRCVPLVITGRTAEWLRSRGIPPETWTRRRP